jgi:hypothetical protein
MGAHARRVRSSTFNAALCLPQVALGLSQPLGRLGSPDPFRSIMGREDAICHGPGLLLGRWVLLCYPARLGCTLTRLGWDAWLRWADPRLGP